MNAAITTAVFEPQMTVGLGRHFLTGYWRQATLAPAGARAFVTDPGLGRLARFRACALLRAAENRGNEIFVLPLPLSPSPNLGVPAGRRENSRRGRISKRSRIMPSREFLTLARVRQTGGKWGHAGCVESEPILGPVQHNRYTT